MSTVKVVTKRRSNNKRSSSDYKSNAITNNKYVNYNKSIQQSKTIVTKSFDNIKNTMNESVSDSFIVSFDVCDKKVDFGVLSASMIFTNKVTLKSKAYVLSITYDDYNKITSTVIIDAKQEDEIPYIVFSSFDKNPLLKYKKYLPSIARSIEKYLK